MNGDVVDVGTLMASGGEIRIATVYDQHAQQVGRLAYLLTGDPDLAEDLAQEAFVNLLGRLGSVRDERAVASYLRRSVVNLASKHWRRVANERRAAARDQPAQLTVGLPDVESQDLVWRTLEALPYRQRAAIVLRFYEDLTERETARVLGCRIGTVKSAVSRGLERVRKEMSSDASE